MDIFLHPNQGLMYSTYPGIPIWPAIINARRRLESNGIQPRGAGADVEEGEVEC